MADTTWLDATAQAELVRSGEVSPTELVDEAIARIESVNPQLNAVIHERFDKARTEAAGDLPDGPFRGVPFLLKDLTALSEGDPIHCGNRALKEAGLVADHDTELVARFRRAGFVFVGRTNVPEFGTSITTESLAYGPAHNPWNLDHSTGGSSGGSAAAVAAGLTSAAHANDGGGSIRIPAANCGLVGLKPSRGRVSLGPDLGEAWMGGVIEHAITRTVRDSAAILDTIAGLAPGDPYTAPPPSRSFAQEVGADPGTLRIGLLDHPLMQGATPNEDAAEAVAAAGRALEQLGHHVEVAFPTEIGDPGFMTAFPTIISAELVADLDHYSSLLGRPIADEELEPGNQAFPVLGRALTAPQYLAAVRSLHRWERRLAAWWRDGGGEHDLLVSPVLNGPPPPLGWLTDPEHGYERLVNLLQYTAQFNMSGQPAVSLPLHVTAGGLPVGVQIVAAYGREDLLIQVASQLEQSVPWADRRPPVHA
ncbi:MAG TPA: amidase [Acidimicrobiales bacterium]|jgi:amidase|nr:amidase [Acidimicrobiales bacterium]